jgi:hypothetical protein
MTLTHLSQVSQCWKANRRTLSVYFRSHSVIVELTICTGGPTTITSVVANITNAATLPSPMQQVPAMLLTTFPTPTSPTQQHCPQLPTSLMQQRCSQRCRCQHRRRSNAAHNCQHHRYSNAAHNVADVNIADAATLPTTLPTSPMQQCRS